MLYGNWNNKKIYKNNSANLIKLIENGENLPNYLEPMRDIIFKELNDARKFERKNSLEK